MASNRRKTSTLEHIEVGDKLLGTNSRELLSSGDLSENHSVHKASWITTLR
jgi:hypothetical protein